MTSAALAGCRLGLNEHVTPWVERLVAQADALGVRVQVADDGLRTIDCGIAAPGSVAAGLLVAEICMGGHGRVALRSGGAEAWPSWLEVHSQQPVLACLGSQYAGWSLAASKEETGGRKFFALGSGPARALAGKEPLYAELGWREQAARGVLVLEVDRPPPPVVVQKVLRDCGLAPQGLTLILTPTSSPAGTTQVVARVLEVALHKAHTLGFDLAQVVEGAAAAPLPVPHPDGVQAMGRTNDAILYGGRVHLWVTGEDAAAADLAHRLPASRSADHGRAFADIFTAVGFDFYRIDPALFAPAEVWVSNRSTGSSFHAGGLHLPLLMAQWLQQAD